MARALQSFLSISHVGEIFLVKMLKGKSLEEIVAHNFLDIHFQYLVYFSYFSVKIAERQKSVISSAG